MRGSWLARPGHLVVVGEFGDVAPHHHPAVQLSAGVGGELEIVVVVASGTRHAMRSAGARQSLSVYYSPETAVATTLNDCAGARGVLSLAGATCVDDDLTAAADRLLDDVLARCATRVGESEAHAQLRAAIDVVADTTPGAAALRDVAGAVALSPDYLGRLFRRQTGSSFAEIARVLRPGGVFTGYDLVRTPLATLVHRVDRSPFRLLNPGELAEVAARHGLDVHTATTLGGHAMRFTSR